MHVFVAGEGLRLNAILNRELSIYSKVINRISKLCFVIYHVLHKIINKTAYEKIILSPLSLTTTKQCSTSISFSEKLAIFQHLTKEGCFLLTENTEAI